MPYSLPENWAETRQRYRDSGRPHQCFVCGSAEIQLHHKTYDRIGAEALDDLVPLCDRHHVEVEQMLAQPGVSRANAHEVLKERWDEQQQFLDSQDLPIDAEYVADMEARLRLRRRSF
jgi:hypothetical protein